RGQDRPEYELLDTGAFDDGRFWVVEVTYAKAGPDDVCVSVSVTNAGPDIATLHVLPHLWFRNTWAWGQPGEPDVPSIEAGRSGGLVARHPTLGSMTMAYDVAVGPAQPLFCDNETNTARLYGVPGRSAYPKDGINDHVVSGAATVNPAGVGTKGALWYRLEVAAGAQAVIRLRLTAGARSGALGPEFNDVMTARRAEADEFY